jgi:hypothetical protein
VDRTATRSPAAGQQPPTLPMRLRAAATRRRPRSPLRPCTSRWLAVAIPPTCCYPLVKEKAAVASRSLAGDPLMAPRKLIEGSSRLERVAPILGKQ